MTNETFSDRLKLAMQAKQFKHSKDRKSVV